MLGWADESAEFSTALVRAREAAQAWWEDIGRKGIGMKTAEFNAQHWKTVMTNRFREDYTERSAVELSGAGGKPVPMTTVLNVRFLSPADVKAPD